MAFFGPIMTGRLTVFLLMAACLPAAEFQNGQAARAVLGQSSFSSREAGLTPVALSIAKTRLYAADSSHRLFTFDLARIASPKDEVVDSPSSACPLCGFAPLSIAEQSVIPGTSAFAVFDKTVVIVESTEHLILIWRDATRGSPQPDVVLGKSGDGSGISAATLVDPVSVAFDGRRLFVGDAGLHRVLVWNTIPVTDDQAADVVLGQASFTSAHSNDVAGADTIRLPAALASDGTNLFVADSADHRILVFTPGDLELSEESVVNSASRVPGSVAPGTLITINLAGLTKTPQSIEDRAGHPAATKLAGVEAYLNGIPLPLLSVSAAGLEAQLPYDLGTALSASLYIRSDRGGEPASISTAVAVKVVAAAPGIYAFGGDEPRTGLLLHSNASDRNTLPSPVTAENPARPGDQLIVWAAGLGLVADDNNEMRASAGMPFTGADAPVLLPVAVSIAGRPVEVISADLPSGAMGVYEIHLILPTDLPSDANTPLVITQNGYESNTVTFPVAAITSLIHEPASLARSTRAMGRCHYRQAGSPADARELVSLRSRLGPRSRSLRRLPLSQRFSRVLTECRLIPTGSGTVRRDWSARRLRCRALLARTHPCALEAHR